MILDTDILIDYLRGKENSKKLLHKLSENESIETTDINVFEMYCRAYNMNNSRKKVSKLKGFMNKIIILSTSEDSMEVAGKLAAEFETDGEKIGAKEILISGMASRKQESADQKQKTFPEN